MVSKLEIEKFKNNLGKLHYKNFIRLKDVIKGTKIYQSDVPSIGGIYAFWWIGNNKKFLSTIISCDYKLKGKKSERELIPIKFTKDWIEASTFENKICLYIGKSTDIRGRISKHLRLKTPDIWGGIDKASGRKPNSESQLRIGMERVFETSTIKDLTDEIAISWIELDGYQNGINRFYLEDYYVGHYFPLFNIDIER